MHDALRAIQIIISALLIPLTLLSLFSSIAIKIKRIKYSEIVGHKIGRLQQKREKLIIYRFFKRLLSFGFSLIGLITLAPLILLICVLVKIEFGHCFVKTKRLGKRCKEITLYSFRTICIDEYGKSIKIPRITSIGRFLRATSLDHLPRLFNVIKGDIDLVGVYSYGLNMFNNYPDKIQEILKFEKPGLIWPDVIYCEKLYQLTIERIIDFDLAYISTHSIITDIRYLFATVISVLRNYNAPLYESDEKLNVEQRHNIEQKN